MLVDSPRLARLSGLVIPELSGTRSSLSGPRTGLRLPLGGVSGLVVVSALEASSPFTEPAGDRFFGELSEMHMLKQNPWN